MTITDAGGLSTTSSVSVTVNQTFNSIALTPASASLHENATQQFAATAYDQFGIALNVQPSFNWSSSGVGSVDASGLYSSAGTSGSATVTAANGAFAGSAIVTVNNAAPTIVTAASASPSPVNGTTTALSVLGADDGGEANLTYTWAATGTPPAPVIFSLNGNNAAKNSTVTFAKAGVYNFLVTVSDGVNATTSSVSVTVNQTLTSINVAPGSATVNENASQQFTATGIDQFGNAMTSQPSFAWSLTSGIGSIDATGQYTSPSAAGSATVQAVSGSVSGTASVTVNNASPTVSTPASATPSPVTGTTTALSALGADDGGEANLIYTWTTTGTPPAAVSFSANGTNAAKNSTATFTKAGTYNFLVTISDGSNSTTSGVSVVVNQTLTSIVVTPATVTLNGSGTQQFTANGLDQFANAMASQPAVTWSVASGVGSIDNAGFYTAPPSTGSATVRAASGAMSGTASITIDNAAPTVATPASATPNPVTGTFTALSVLGADDGGESNLTYTWVVAGTPPAAVTFSDNNTNSAKNATATFVKAGIYDLTVTIADSQGLTTTSSVTVTVDQTASTLAISPASVGMNENGTQQFSAIAYDQFGDALQAQPTINWSIGSGIGSIDSSGLYTAPASAGTATIAASTGSVTGSASVTVSNGTPTIVTPASANPSPVIGTTTNLVVLGADDGGEANLIYTWATTGTPPAGVNFSANGTNAAKNSIAAFSKAGTYNFIVTISDGTLSVSSLVTVVVGQTVSAITVSPTSAAVIGGSSQQFTASATDQFGDSIPEPNFTWTLDTNSPGSLSAAALYTTQPADAGTAVVRATSAGISSTASVNVTTAVPEAPANLIAAAVLPTEVQLQWNDSSPALENGFRIERSADNVHWSAVGSVAAGTTSFTDSALQAQTIYFYRVFATSSAGADSAPSNVASVTTPQVILPPPPPPPPPSGLPIDNGGTGPTNGGSTGGTTGTSGDSTGPQTISNGPGTGGTNDSGSNPASGSTPTNANPAEDAAPTNTTAQNSPPSDAPKSDGSNAAPPAHPSDASNGTPRQGAVGNDPHSTPAGPNASHDNDRSNGGSKLMAARVSNDDADASRPLIAPADLQATVATADAYGALGSREQVQQEAATVAEREASHKKQQVTTSRVAATVTATAVAGYAIWLVQGGSLLLSAITTMPFWRWFDPLPVLDSWEKASAARRSKQAGRKQKNKGKQKDEERELDGIID